MGRGNVCVFGQYEGLYYIDRDDYESYFDHEDEDWKLVRDIPYDELTGERYEYDAEQSEDELGCILDYVSSEFIKKHPEFYLRQIKFWPNRSDRELWISRSQKVLLESELFYICAEDNEWSLAIELIQREAPWGDEDEFEAEQGKRYQEYLETLKECLLDYLPAIGTYSGAWTSGWITREEYQQEKEALAESA